MSRVHFFVLPLLCFLLHGLAALAKIPIENPPFVFTNSNQDKLKRNFLNVDTPWDNDDVLAKPPYSLYVTLENFPNPFIHPSLCNRNGLSYSYLCDPNKILSRSTADKIEEILSYQRRNSSHYCADRGEVPYVLGVALIERLPYGVSAETFSSQILEHWKLGNRNCNDGILLLFVKENATFVLKWRKGAQSIINFRTATAMNKSFNMYIRRYSLEYSILRAVTLTSQYLTEEIIPPTQTAQMVVALTIGIVVGLGYLACILIDAEKQLYRRMHAWLNTLQRPFVFSDAQKGNR